VVSGSHAVIVPATVSKISSEKEGSAMTRFVTKTYRWIERGEDKAKVKIICGL